MEAYPPIDRKARSAGGDPGAASPAADARNGSPPDPGKDAGP
jgi:hypothetical protein